MPARTVLFTNVQKFDGKDFRWISSGEYIQMSGRYGHWCNFDQDYFLNEKRKISSERPKLMPPCSFVTFIIDWKVLHVLRKSTGFS